jgi:hypothetical protein
LQDSLSTAESLDEVARLEAHAASAYWFSWNDLPINFPRQDVTRVPEHWRMFGTRKSLITGSPRLATNPPNAILNYCYALLECETRLASVAVGLDPGMGMLHVDTPARDSLACDIMEAVRPSVDAWLLDWITREPFRRSDFFEERNGNCRLLRTLAAKLSETTSVWAKLVAPWAEYLTHTLWATTSRPTHRSSVPTRLTQQHRRDAKSGSAPTVAIPKPDRACRGCGKTIRAGRSDCGKCAIDGATQRLVEAARIGRIAAHTPEAIAKEANTQRQHAKARSSWATSSQPSWLTSKIYSEKIQPRLAEVSTSAIASGIGVSRWYAGKIRHGYRPHPRHWQAMAELVGLSTVDYNGHLFEGKPPTSSPAASESVDYFAPARALLESIAVPNQFTANAIDRLLRVYQNHDGHISPVRVDYSTLRVRELGTIYEGLLEWKLEPVAAKDVEDGSIRLLGEKRIERTVVSGDYKLVADQADRKATGSYYTPHIVVEFIGRNSLLPLLKEIETGCKGDPHLIIEKVLGQRILDPAMGSGHFLVFAVEYIADYVSGQLGLLRAALQTGKKKPSNPKSLSLPLDAGIEFIRARVAERCIFGVDINPLAVELAKLSLWISTVWEAFSSQLPEPPSEMWRQSARCFIVGVSP